MCVCVRPRIHAVNKNMSCAVVDTLRLAMIPCPKGYCRRENDGLRPCEHTKTLQSTATMQQYELAESRRTHYCYCLHSAVLHWPPLPATDLSPLPNSCLLKVLLVSLPAQPPTLAARLSTTDATRPKSTLSPTLGRAHPLAARTP